MRSEDEGPTEAVTTTGAEVIDRRLVTRSRIVCAAGDHRHAVVLDPRDVVWLSDAKIADICADGARRI